MTRTKTVTSPMLSDPPAEVEKPARVIDPDYADTLRDRFIEPNPDVWFASLRRSQ